MVMYGGQVIVPSGCFNKMCKLPLPCIYHAIPYKAKKKKIVVLPLSWISEYLGWSVRKYILFLIILFKKHPKVQNLDAFSTFFFFFFAKKMKKHTI